ncbi:MAG: DUF4957 domain-containing protein, partial [Bacteroidales bacterium]|nr:DUF4957 domain-containing protein [Bacteroidales bacterium]
TANTGILVDMYSVQADEIPYTVYNLTVDKSFYARVRGVNPDLQASNWAYLEKTFSTSAVRASLNPVVKTRTQTSVTIGWDNAADKADLTSVLVEPVVLKEGDAPETKVSLEAADIAAASKTVDGLQAGREYRFTLLFGKAGKRGSVTANTRPNIDGTPTVISSAAALLAALDNQAGTIKLMLDYAEDAYDITPLYPDQTKKYATIVGDVYLYGNATEAGKKPSVSGLVFSLANGATKLHTEDVVFDGAGTDAIVVNTAAAMASIEHVNCDISGYTKGIYSVASSATGKVDNYLVEGCYVHDINADGSVGGDFIDVRAGDNGDFTVRNSTFYACARTFFRMSDNAKVANVLAENCTFNYVTATPSSSNNAGIFAVRVKAKTDNTSVKAIRNVFLNEYNEKEGETADKGWVRLCRNSTDSYRVECTGNVYFNMGVAWWTSGAVASPTDALGDKTFEEIAKTDATMLTADPCVNSAAGKLYLAGTAGEQVRSLKAGDPRWWDAVMPVVVREKELKLVEDAFTWDFTQKTIYDTEELTANTIIGNARIYATSSVPAKVVMSKGIDFSTGASVSPAGVPSYSAVEVLVKDYGSVKVTATSDDGIGSMQVLAGGDRYAVLADGKEHTVTLGDLSGENSIYVIANSAVTLKKVAWTKDLTPDATATALKTPVVTVTPNKLDEGTAEAVVIEWAAIENAADYVLTFNGAEQILTATSYTVAAEVVAALAAADYPVSVVARPVTTSSKYVASAAGEATLKINKVVSGAPVTLTWDMSSSAWQAALAAAGSKATAIANWNMTVDDLQWYSTEKSKWNNDVVVNEQNMYYIQAGGTGKTSNHYFKFTAPAEGTLTVVFSNSGNNAARGVTIKCGSDDAIKSTVTSTSKTPSTATFENVKAGDVLIYGADGGICYYKIEFTYMAASAKEAYSWDFSTADWQTALANQASAACHETNGGNNVANWTVTCNGLTYTSGSKNGRWSTTGWIQTNGGGDATGRVFTFTVGKAGTVRVTGSNTGDAVATDGRGIGVTDSTGALTPIVNPNGVATNPKTPSEFSVAAGDIAVYSTVKGIRFYKIEFESD